MTLKQAVYLWLVSITGLVVVMEWSQLFQAQAWIIPEVFGHSVGLRGIVSDLLIIAIPTVWLLLMGWLPGQMQGGMKVSLVLVACIAAYKTIITVREFSDFFSSTDGMPWLDFLYDLRGWLIFVLLPFLVIEGVRRRLDR